MIILLLIVWFLAYMIYRSLRKSKCRKHGHKWIQRRGYLKCKRCKRKSRLVTVVKPESKGLR